MSEFKTVIDRNRKVSHAETAYEEIKQLILNDEIKPGELIRESDIAEYLQMSRTPVREAIRRLEAEEVLYIRQGLGSFLKTLSIKDIRDIYEVREQLEAVASRTAIKHITAEEIDAVRRQLSELLEDYRTGAAVEVARYDAVDAELHNLVLKRSDNDYVKILMRHVNFKVARYRLFSCRVSLEMEESTRQHLQLLDDLENRDGEQFARHIREHLHWSLGLIQENFEY